jgi:hypothetical protein
LARAVAHYLAAFDLVYLCVCRDGRRGVNARARRYAKRPGVSGLSEAAQQAAGFIAKAIFELRWGQAAVTRATHNTERNCAVSKSGLY